MARMLFVNWNDGAPPSQFSVPAGSTLEELLNTPIVTLDTGTELYLDQPRIRTAYLIDVPEGTLIHLIDHATPIPAPA